MKKKYVIAFSGVFNIANYGDHLFPIIYKKWMEINGIDCEIDLFSSIECSNAFFSDIHVYSEICLGEMVLKKKYDYIIVSGGALIHFKAIDQKMNDYDNSFYKYPIYESWIIPSIVGAVNGIPVLWNAPGVPYDFDESEKKLFNYLIKLVDFIAVRNVESKKSILTSLGCEDKPIVVSPDPAFLVSRFFANEKLEIIRERLKIEKKYIVFHTHRLIPKEILDKTINILQKLADSKGYRICLLPLAYTHADNEICEKIMDMTQNDSFFTFSNKLSLEDMIAVLAGCEMYIGTSFHGAITAYSYGKRVIALDFFKYRKTCSLFHTMGMDEYYLTDTKLLDEKIQKILKNPYDNSEKMKSIQNQIDTMYTNMLNMHQNLTKKENPCAWIEYISILQLEYDFLFRNKYIMNNFKLEKEMDNEYIENLKTEIQNLQFKIEEFSDENTNKENYIEALKLEWVKQHNQNEELKSENKKIVNENVIYKEKIDMLEKKNVAYRNYIEILERNISLLE